MPKGSNAKQPKRKTWRAKMRERLASHRKSFIIWNILRVITIVVAIFALINQNYEAFVLCLVTLILYLVPSFVEERYKVTIPDTLMMIVICFIFAAEICGESLHFYTIFPFWDTLLHTLNGFLAAAIGFSFVTLLNNSPRIAFYVSPLFCALTAFCFSMTIGVLWEFLEFTCDCLMGVDMQKDTVVYSISSILLDPTLTQTPFRIDDIQSVVVNGQELGIGGYLDIGLIDTMQDLMVNAVGALVFAVIGYFYVKKKSAGDKTTGIVEALTLTPDDKPPSLESKE